MGSAGACVGSKAESLRPFSQPFYKHGPSAGLDTGAPLCSDARERFAAGAAHTWAGVPFVGGPTVPAAACRLGLAAATIADHDGGQGRGTVHRCCLLSVYPPAWGLHRLFLLYAYLLSLVGGGFHRGFPLLSQSLATAIRHTTSKDCSTAQQKAAHNAGTTLAPTDMRGLQRSGCLASCGMRHRMRCSGPRSCCS